MAHIILCRFCGETNTEVLRVHKVNHYKNGTSKTYYSCRSCNRKRAAEYRKTPSGKISTTKSVQKYDKANPERRRAWNKCQYLGSKPCEICSVEKTDKHHPDITKPFDVVWLCRLHHREAHANKV